MVYCLFGAFQKYCKLTFNISDTLEENGKNTFADCKKLKFITIPSSVAKIEARAK